MLEEIVLFRYDGSPFARKCEYAAAYYKLKYAWCTLDRKADERHAFKQLGLTHRRIPIMAVGSEIYFDSNLILEKFEELSTSSRTLKLQSALSNLAPALVESQVFWAMVRYALPFYNGDAIFMKDRADTFGGMFKDPSSLMLDESRARLGAELQSLLEQLKGIVAETSDDAPFIGYNKEPSVLDLSLLSFLGPFASRLQGIDELPPAPYTSHDGPLAKYLARVHPQNEKWQSESPPEHIYEEKDVASELFKAALPPLPTQPRFNDPQNLSAKLGTQVALYARDTGVFAQKGKLVYVDASKMAVEFALEGKSHNARAWARRLDFEVRDD